MKHKFIILILLIPYTALFSQDLETLSKEIVFGEDLRYSQISYKYFMSLIEDQKLGTKNIYKPNGVAISPDLAANCMLESERTKAFVRALYLATKGLEKDTVKIFYVGCGPLAPFMTLTAPLLPNARYDLVEISENSAQIAKTLINRLDLQDQLDTMIIADATKMIVPKGQDYDIIITETMYAGLNREMMIPILINILPQLKEDVILIPEEVILELNFLKKEQNSPQDLIKQEIFTATELLKCYLEENEFPIVNFLPQQNEWSIVFIGTKVKVFGAICLNYGESSITEKIPIKLKPKESLQFSYCITPPKLLINDAECNMYR